MLQTYYFIGLMCRFYNIFCSFRMSIRNEKLTKFIVVNHFDNFTYSKFV